MAHYKVGYRGCRNLGMSKVIFSGLEGEGKSLRLAMQGEMLVERNAKFYKQFGVTRPIASNLKFSDTFVLRAEKQHVPILYWENLDDLVKLEQCDVLMDECGNYFDSRMWSDLSLDVRRWLTQGSKCGIELYGTAQDFAQVDKSFRRLVNELYYIKKFVGSPRPSATKPPVKKIWGICWIFALDPRTYNEEDDKFQKLSVFDWRFFRIQEKYCKIFDTTQKITRSKPAAKRHEEWFCELHNQPGHACDYRKIVHI